MSQENSQDQGGDKLFRDEVFENKKETFVGKVLIDKSMAPYALPIFVIVITIIGTFIAIFGSYTEKVKAIGWLEPDQGLVRVFASGQGVIEQVLVTQNQEIAANTRLIDIRNEVIGADGVSTTETILASLNNSLDKLYGDLDARIALSQSRAQTLDQQIAGLQLQIDSLSGRNTIQAEQTQMIQSQFDKLSDMAERRLIPVTQALNSERELIASKSQQAQLGEALVRLEAELAQAVSQRAQIPSTLALEVSQVQREIASQEERIVQMEVQTETTLESPVGGRIAFLAVREAETIAPGLLVATIIPEGSELQAILYPPSSVANKASVGDQVRLKYDAFPYQTFGTYDGEIIEISDSAISQQELPRQFAQTPGEAPEPRFRILVKLNQDYVQKGDEITYLQSDAKFQAEILLKERKLYSLVTGSFFQ